MGTRIVTSDRITDNEEVSLETILEGTNIAVSFLMRPQDWTNFDESIIKDVQEFVIEEQKIGLVPIRGKNHRGNWVTVEIPNISKHFFEYFYSFWGSNKSLLNNQSLDDSIASLRKLLKNYPDNPDGWKDFEDDSEFLTKINIKQIIETLDLTASCDEIGVNDDDFLFLIACICAENYAEKKYLRSYYLKKDEKPPFDLLPSEGKPKKIKICCCKKCGKLFFRKSHQAFYCEFCKPHKRHKNWKPEVKLCKCGCGTEIKEGNCKRVFYKDHRVNNWRKKNKIKKVI